MKRTIKHVASWFTAAAIGAAFGLAPVASADLGSTPEAQSNLVADATLAPSPGPAPVESGASPLVPPGTDPAFPEPYDPYLKNPAGGIDLPS